MRLVADKLAGERGGEIVFSDALVFAWRGRGAGGLPGAERLRQIHHAA